MKDYDVKAEINRLRGSKEISRKDLVTSSKILALTYNIQKTLEEIRGMNKRMDDPIFKDDTVKNVEKFLTDEFFNEANHQGFLRDCLSR